ncbi:MAG: MG2 domain-containing protein [Myxococcota bacterium]|nr:MG2 domain-containing protein [Myxococcota bacterium]
MTLSVDRRTLGVLTAALVLLVGLVALTSSLCVTAWWRYGISVDQCPDGEVRGTYELTATGLQRGGEGSISLQGTAHFTTDGLEQVHRAPFEDFQASLLLVDGAGKSQPLERVKDTGWEVEHGLRSVRIQVPVVPDGEYLLRATLTSALGTEQLDTPVAFYAPARVHVLTDRPLYEPGQQIQFRSVVLRARDLAPLDGRPGVWTVIDPSDQVVLEEKVPAGPWGVSSGSFPLDRGAPTGRWRIRWSSGDATDEASVQVEPFTVPRFRIEAAAVRPFYRGGERPVLQGAVRYASGAPVANATLQLSWTTHGDWPPPTAWSRAEPDSGRSLGGQPGGGPQAALPQVATAGRDGRFTLELPPIPEDLRGRNTLAATLTAIDSAGDRVGGAVSVLLSGDALAVDNVTELGDGLVEGLNNRLYLRATTPDGIPLTGATLRVRRAWDAKDPGVSGVADEDGVASLQIDPGVPVNVVVPPMPFRPAPPEPSVALEDLDELIGGEVSLADQVAMEKALSAFEPCALLTLEEQTPQLAIRLAPSGAVIAVGGGASRLERCLREVAQGRRFPAGRDRLLVADLGISPANAPWVGAEWVGSPEVPSEVPGLLAEALLGTRACLPAGAEEGRLPRALEWRTRAGSDQLELAWVSDPNGEIAPAGVAECLRSRLPTWLGLGQKRSTEAMGIAALSLHGAEGVGAEDRPQATTFLGYDFLVSATVEGREVGTTRLRMRPGSVPPLRLRPSAVVASAGDKLEVQLLRGPGYLAPLPKQVNVLVGAAIQHLEVEDKRVVFSVPPDAAGWLRFETQGAQALVYVRSGSDLSVAIMPDQPAYRPGALAHLKLETRVGGEPAAAAVGLFGVDETLGQLAPLEGAQSLARVRPQVAMSAPAFGSLDAQALMLGRIRGAHAAAATVLRVTSPPPREQADRPVGVRHASVLDANGELTDVFYTVLSELHSQARRWESSAAKDQQASPATVARLWKESLEACASRGQRTTDAFGRPLRLSLLPPDLLALTDPRAVIVEATRLPEDVENWNQWVAEEQP